MERLAPGAMVAGKYRIDRELGAGAMGAVYVAENVVLEKEDADEADLVVIDGDNVVVAHWVRLDVFDLATGAHRFRIGDR